MGIKQGERRREKFSAQGPFKFPCVPESNGNPRGGEGRSADSPEVPEVPKDAAGRAT
jgi:hypothetical protein